MKFSHLTERIAGEGAGAWAVHFEAMKRKRRGEKVIVLSVGEPNFDTPPAIVAAAKSSLDRGRTHYTDIVGDPPLRAAIARRHGRLTGQEVGPENVVVLAGAQCALFSVALCLLDPGDEIIVPEPMYVTYEAVVGVTGATMRRVGLDAANGFHLKAAEIAAAIGPRTRAVLINSPNNPTGAMIRRAELEALAEICRRQDLWLIADEVYGSLIFEGEHVSPAGLPGMAERTITVDSLSKSHAMTGWRLGWAVGPHALMGHVAHLALCMLYGSPGFVQDAALVAIEQDLPEVGARHSQRPQAADRARHVGDAAGRVDRVHAEELERAGMDRRGAGVGDRIAEQDVEGAHQPRISTPAPSRRKRA